MAYLLSVSFRFEELVAESREKLMQYETEPVIEFEAVRTRSTLILCAQMHGY
jgi:hypothetical protein